MKHQRLYLETTMFNYYFDTDRGDNHLATVELFENIGSEINFGFSSTFVDYELKKAPEPKKSNILNLILKYNIIVLDYKKEIYNLSDIYIKEWIIPKAFEYDAYHIASATVHKLDCLVSFNFKHIIKRKTKEKVSSTNLIYGYNTLYICTPQVVLNDEE